MAPRQRNQRLKYFHISSSSAKRKKLKDHNCFYCYRNIVTSQDLKQHLNENENCLALYLRKFGTKSLIAVLQQSFSCIACSLPPGSKLFYHLKTSQRCLDKYKEDFNVDDLR